MKVLKVKNMKNPWVKRIKQKEFIQIYESIPPHPNYKKINGIGVRSYLFDIQYKFDNGRRRIFLLKKNKTHTLKSIFIALTNQLLPSDNFKFVIVNHMIKAVKNHYK